MRSSENSPERAIAVRTSFFSFLFRRTLLEPRAPSLILLLVLSITFALISSAQAATGDKAMVVSSDPRATQAALEILKQGGNAVDAAVAAQWVLAVVEPQASGPGGGGLLLFYDIGTRRILSFDGSVKAPSKAFPGMFLDKEHKPLPYQLGRNTGGLPVGVPGLLKLLDEVHGKYGSRKFTFAKLMDPAVCLAEAGTEVSPSLARALRQNAKRLMLLDPSGKFFFDKGVPLAEGENMVQPELGRMLRLVQSRGAEVFYRGAIAKAIRRVVHRNAGSRGLLSEKDLEGYAVASRDPVHAAYEGYDLFSAAAPADGGVTLFRGLNFLSAVGIPLPGRTPETYHLLAETQKVAFSSRSGVADPDLFEVPIAALLSDVWAKDRAKLVRNDQVLKSPEMTGAKMQDGAERTGSSVMVVDTRGNMAILAATLGDAFGSALKVPGYGFFLNDLLTSFNPDPSSVNDSGSAELVSGGQRPRGPEVPVFFFKEGKPSGLMNGYGPDDPAAALLNMVVQRVDLGASCAQAVGSPRLWVRDGAVLAEPGLYDQEMIRLKLTLLGHDVRKEATVGSAQMICFDEGSGKIEGASDPRAAGEAAGF